MMQILIPLDGSGVAEEAVRHAVSIAEVFPSELVLLRAVAESDTGATVRADAVDLALWRHQARSYLNGLREQYSGANISIRCEVVEGNSAEAIVDFMTASKPDLLVLTRYGRGNAQDFAAGGTAQKILARAACSVLLVDPSNQDEPPNHYSRILVPIDDSKESDCAVAIATVIAEIHNASLLLLHVTEEPHLPTGIPDTRHTQTMLNELLRIIRLAAENRLRELANKIPKTVPVDTRVIVSSDAAFAIDATAEANNCDLLLLHTSEATPNRGRGFGSVNQSLVQFSHRPLFVLRPAAAEGIASNFRSVYLDEPRLEVG